VPLTWSDSENVIWTSDVPGRGSSSPTVVGDRVYLTSCDEPTGSQSVYAFDRGTGQLVWKQQVHAQGAMRKHERSTGASSSVTCDGERLFIAFPNADAVVITALSLDGKEAWQTKLCDYVIHQGYGASPFLYQDTVLVSADHKGGGAVAALDRYLAVACKEGNEVDDGGLVARCKRERANQRALELAPGLMAARAQAIEVALQQKQPDKALAIARRLQTERPGDAAGWLLEGEVQMRQRQWASAATVLRQAVQRQSPGAAPVRLYQALAQGDRPADAEAFASQWLQNHPADTSLLFTMAGTAQTQGDLPRAQQHYERLLAVQADHAMALNNLAMVRLLRKEPGARALAERAVATAPQNAALLDTLAQAQAAEGQLDAALATQNSAVAAAPQAPALRLNLARILLQAGDRAKAKTELDRLAALGDGFSQQADVRQLLQTLGPSLSGR
jgi:tetratricopeptide (TPR) repeat protein